MAITIDPTVGGAGANSYVTLAEAETYFEGRLNITNWTGTDDNKNRALAQATNRLDQVRWKSTKADSSQALEWPRYAAIDLDGNAIESDEIPQCIKDAQCELALAMLGSDLLANTGLEGFINVKAGPLDVTPRHGYKAGDLPENVYREISHFVRSSRGQVRIERA